MVKLESQIEMADRGKTVSPFACELAAIPADERLQHLATAQELFQSVERIRELKDGYAFQIRDTPGALIQAAQFVHQERLCCPFFGFVIEVEAENGAAWLHLTGRDGVKEFIRVEIAEFLGKEFSFESLLERESQG